MSQDLAVDIAKQEISSGYLEFFELEIGTDTTGNGNNVLFFHDGKNENTADITYDGNTLQNLQSNAAANLTLKTTSNSFNSLILDSNRAADTQFGIIDGRWNGNVVNRIQFVTGGRAPAQSGGASFGSTKMTILGNGNVGIGNASPSFKLQVNGTVRINSGDSFLDDGQSIRWGGTAAKIDGSSGGDYLRFYTDGAERMRVISGGNVGIGTDSPNAKLKVITSSTDVAIFQSTHATTTNFYISCLLYTSPSPRD